MVKKNHSVTQSSVRQGRILTPHESLASVTLQCFNTHTHSPQSSGCTFNLSKCQIAAGSRGRHFIFPEETQIYRYIVYISKNGEDVSLRPARGSLILVMAVWCFKARRCVNSGG